MSRLESYLWDELNNHYAERETWMQDINQWQKDYWAKPVSKQATFPFTGASTLIVPLTAIAVESVHASMMTSLYAMDDLVHGKSISNYWDEALDPYLRYLNYTLKNVVGIEKVSNDLSLENVKFGTCVAKSGYEKLVKRAVRQVGDRLQEFEVRVKDGPFVDSVSLGRFLMPFQCQDPQTASWVGEEHDKSPYEVKVLQDSGFFYEGIYEFLLAYVSQSNSGINGQERAMAQVQEQLEDRVPVYPKYLNWAEINLSFPTKIDGPDEELVVHYHRGSRKIMSVRYNENSDLHRPYRYTNYFPVEHRWAGIGIGKQNEQFQREVTMIHRQRLDGGTLSNTIMFKIHKMSGYGPKEPIFPGKMWFLDDMSHIEGFPMHDIKPSSFANEQGALVYSQQRSGVNELTLGMPQAGTPGTATSDLSRIQEGKKKFDYSFKLFKKLHLEVITDTACLMQQYGPRMITQTMAGGEFVDQILQLPDVFIRDGLIFELAITGQNSNKVLDRQNWVQLAQITQQFWTGQIQLAQLTGNPELLQAVTMKAMDAINKVYKQILETYDIRNIDKISLDALLGVTNGNLIGGNGATAQIGGPSGMANAGQNGGGLTPIIIGQPS